MSNAVVLHLKDEFKEVLKDYHASDEAKALLQDMPLVILQGITGSGRNTLINYLVDTAAYHAVVSDTTRPPKVRDGKLEVDGINYHFRSETQVLNDLRNGLFLEAELIHDQQVSGISLRELKNAQTIGKIPINEVAREGVDNIREAKPDTICIFVVPPSYEVWVDRLTKREQMSDVEFKNRSHSAKLEIEAALSNDFFTFVVNDSIERAARAIDEVVHRQHVHEEHERGIAAAREILQKLQNS